MENHAFIKDMHVSLRCLDTPLDFEGWTDQFGEISKWYPANQRPVVASCSVHAAKSSHWRLYFEASPFLPAISPFKRILVEFCVEEDASQYFNVLLQGDTFVSWRGTDAPYPSDADTWETPALSQSTSATCIDTEKLLSCSGESPSMVLHAPQALCGQKRSAVETLMAMADGAMPPKRRRIDGNGEDDGEFGDDGDFKFDGRELKMEQEQE
jgi:hypothetical protein